MANIKVTLVKSTIGEIASVKATVAALGLKKIRSSNTFSPKNEQEEAAIRGQIKKVAHLVKVENV